MVAEEVEVEVEVAVAVTRSSFVRRSAGVRRRFELMSVVGRCTRARECRGERVEVGKENSKREAIFWRDRKSERENREESSGRMLNA